MRTIALEEHYATPTFLAGAGRYLAPFDALVAQLCDLDAGRIDAMDAAGVDVAVLSLTAPGVEQLGAPDAVAVARDANDLLGAAVGRHPDRLRGFATVPTPSPQAAAEELERTVGEYGFVGAVVNGHTAGRYLDDRFFWPILERASGLGVPVYLHPTPPPDAVTRAAYGGFAPKVVLALSTAAWGWHVDTATHVLRLVLGGVFDRFPDLQVVIGHMGETLPFLLPRFDLALPTPVTGLARPVSAYLRENLHYTFAGFNWVPTFLSLLAQVGAERILFSTDHPYGSMREARDFLDALPVGSGDRARIAHGNAERLLGR
ncbi:MAG TPA: amidohydrolase family protein [Pseudonocardia sp.]|nr:amidohydrolase family protein [Pseudonocardia sp.]